MAITFTSGISFSGGINFITEAPAEAAWFGGGSGPCSYEDIS